jgi:glutaminase
VYEAGDTIVRGAVASVGRGVYRSEAETGHRNRAIAHLLRNFDVIVDAPDAALDLYFRRCSISVPCRDLAIIAATLANGGVNPLTEQRHGPARARRPSARQVMVKVAPSVTAPSVAVKE